jgi:hypothetical protein
MLFTANLLAKNRQPVRTPQASIHTKAVHEEKFTRSLVGQNMRQVGGTFNEAAGTSASTAS